MSDGLDGYVAVNPFLGFSDQTFAATCATFRRVTRVDMLMPRAFYRQALTQGRIEDRDVEAGLRAIPPGGALPASVAALTRAVESQALRPERPNRVVATVADVLDALAAGDRQLSRTAFMVDPRRRAALQGQRVALVDDVMTTGATAGEAATVLLRAGASAVDIWVLARTPET